MSVSESLKNIKRIKLFGKRHTQKSQLHAQPQSTISKSQDMVLILPDEVILHVFLYLSSINDLVSICRVCKLFRRVGGTSVLWEKYMKSPPKGMHPVHKWLEYIAVRDCSVRYIDSRGRLYDEYFVQPDICKIKLRDELSAKIASNWGFYSHMLMLLPECSNTSACAVDYIVKELYSGKVQGLTVRCARQLLNGMELDIKQVKTLVWSFENAATYLSANMSVEFAHKFLFADDTRVKLLAMASHRKELAGDVIRAYTIAKTDQGNTEHMLQSINPVDELITSHKLQQGVLPLYVAHLNNSGELLCAKTAASLGRILNNLKVPVRELFCSAPRLPHAIFIPVMEVLCDGEYINQLLDAGTLSPDSISLFASVVLLSASTVEAFVSCMNAIKFILDTMMMRPDTLFSVVTMASEFDPCGLGALLTEIVSAISQKQVCECAQDSSSSVPYMLEEIVKARFSKNDLFKKLRRPMSSFHTILFDILRADNCDDAVRDYKVACSVVMDEVLYNDQIPQQYMPGSRTAKRVRNERRLYEVGDMWSFSEADLLFDHDDDT